MARLLSVNVGLPRDIAWHGKTVRTGVWKAPVAGRRMVRRLNIDGDGQGDLAGHGGEHRAVLVYQAESYRHWQSVLGRRDLAFGQFGENFSVEGLPDDEVCIGDRYRIGAALFEVTQPRVTCYRLGIRMDEPRMAAMLVADDRPGFYCRVIEEGEVAAGDAIDCEAREPERMTVSEVNALLYKPGHPVERLARAVRIRALSAGWRGSFQDLLDRSGGTGTSPAQSSRAHGWSGFRQMRVARKDAESATVTSVTLVPVDGMPLETPLPGQFLLLRLNAASDGPALLRSYSLSGPQSLDSYRVSVKRLPQGRAGTFVATRLAVGDRLEASAPSGSFTLVRSERPIVFLSAGIGATPLLAMLHAIVAARLQNEVWWIYGTKNGGEHPFAREVQGLLAQLPGSHRHIRYSSPLPSDRPVIDYQAEGRLDATLVQELDAPRDADFYLCGPATFMRDLAAGLERWGVDGGRIHSEVFGAKAGSTPGVVRQDLPAPHPPDGSQGEGPLVSFARSSLTVRWRPSLASLLELAEACDVPVSWSCRTGVCHTCVTSLIEGALHYDPAPIEGPEAGKALICCSQPCSDVVLDL